MRRVIINIGHALTTGATAAKYVLALGWLLIAPPSLPLRPSEVTISPIAERGSCAAPVKRLMIGDSNEVVSRVVWK